ncbi:hypothetical protein LCGC14_2501450, partial [marine sediment metagenome]
MTKFTDLNLNAKVLKAVVEAGYESPTPIQAGAIPPALEGRDVLGIAQTGTGKTASFTLPMLSLLARGRARARMPRSLVLCPTRELAAQVAENFDTYSKHLKLTKALLIGGVSFKEQDKLIDKGVDVLIATPGQWHTPMAVSAMKAGKYAAVEVPASITLEQCWELVDTHEQTGVPCMMLENWAFR